MKADRWARLKELLDQATELSPEKRSSFLDAECGADLDLRKEIDELLSASSDLDEFISPPEGHVIPVDEIIQSAGSEGLLGKVGEFQLIRELGRGGRGVVYLAKSEITDRVVALKVLSLAALPSAVSIERFNREARATTKLDHPAIVKVQGIEQDLGRPFLVMDYIDGRSLAAEIESLHSKAEAQSTTLLRNQKGLLPSRIAELTQKLADALQHAHERGIIHRDIKPQNILLDLEGEPHLVDFGLARNEEEVTLTLTGEVEGTPNYMSPEQVKAAGRGIDHRTDIYSLGVVLYELLTHRRPFEAPTANQVMQNISRRLPERVRQVNSDIPRDLELICMKAMEKRPKHRYATAAEFSEDLGRFLRHESVQASAPNVFQRVFRSIERQPLPWGMTAAAVLLVAGTVFFQQWQNRRSAVEAFEAAVDALPLKAELSLSVPDLTSYRLAQERVLGLYSTLPPALVQRVESVDEWRERAANFLRKEYQVVKRQRVSIGLWLLAPKEKDELMTLAASEAFADAMTRLGFSLEVMNEFFVAQQPILNLEIFPIELRSTCQISIRRYFPAEGIWLEGQELGLASELSPIPLEVHTIYRIDARSADGSFAECSLLPLPNGSRFDLKIRLQNRSAHEQMIPVQGAPYQWDHAGIAGGPAIPIHQSDFLADPVLVTFGQFRQFLRETGNSDLPNWPTDEEDLAKLEHKSVVYLTEFDMLSYAAWQGKRLITLPEHQIAARGPEQAKYPPKVNPVSGDPTMKLFGVSQHTPADAEAGFQYWDWMIQNLPDVNNVAEFDHGPSGMGMIWGGCTQMTESSSFASSAGWGYKSQQWYCGSNLTSSPERLLERGLSLAGVVPFGIPEYLAGFRCAISQNALR